LVNVVNVMKVMNVVNVAEIGSGFECSRSKRVGSIEIVQFGRSTSGPSGDTSAAAFSRKVTQCKGRERGDVAFISLNGLNGVEEEWQQGRRARRKRPRRRRAAGAGADPVQDDPKDLERDPHPIRGAIVSP
jgi:hypothetical protein